MLEKRSKYRTRDPAPTTRLLGAFSGGRCHRVVAVAAGGLAADAVLPIATAAVSAALQLLMLLLATAEAATTTALTVAVRDTSLETMNNVIQT